MVAYIASHEWFETRQTCDHRIVLAVRRELGYYLIARNGNPIRVDPEEWANRWGDTSALRKTAVEAGFSKPLLLANQG